MFTLSSMTAHPLTRHSGITHGAYAKMVFNKLLEFYSLQFSHSECRKLQERIIVSQKIIHKHLQLNGWMRF